MCLYEIHIWFLSHVIIVFKPPSWILNCCSFRNFWNKQNWHEFASQYILWNSSLRRTRISGLILNAAVGSGYQPTTLHLKLNLEWKLPLGSCKSHSKWQKAVSNGIWTNWLLYVKARAVHMFSHFYKGKTVVKSFLKDKEL